jgi:hypothetical protein
LSALPVRLQPRTADTQTWRYSQPPTQQLTAQHSILCHMPHVSITPCLWHVFDVLHVPCIPAGVIFNLGMLTEMVLANHCTATCVSSCLRRSHLVVCVLTVLQV